MSDPDSPELLDPSPEDERRATLERDAALIRRTREGDTTAFDELVRAYMRQVFQTVVPMRNAAGRRQ